jgi:hypothetical protein
MPVRQLRSARSPDHQALTTRLVQEWRQPDPNAPEPVILEEFDNGGALVHVYVVWSAWAHVDRAARGEIIMDAAEARYGHDDTAGVTIAMGLIPDEADKLNISWR